MSTNPFMGKFFCSIHNVAKYQVLGGDWECAHCEAFKRQTEALGSKYKPNPPGPRDNMTEVAIPIFKEDKQALDTQVGGNHYKEFVIQPIEFAMKNKLDACQHAVIKYICRFRDKGGKQDLEKIKHYVDILIQMEYPN